jgi:hypothetical protein
LMIDRWPLYGNMTPSPDQAFTATNSPTDIPVRIVETGSRTDSGREPAPGAALRLSGGTKGPSGDYTWAGPHESVCQSGLPSRKSIREHPNRARRFTQFEVTTLNLR